MTTALDSFISETQLAVTETTLFATLVNEKKFIGAATVTNTSASSVEVTLWRISTTTNGTIGSGGNWFWKKTIPSNITISIDPLLGQVLGNLMQLTALASVADVVNIDISGTTETTET